MTTTPILALDELASGQAIPEVTVNEWARWLEFFAAGGGIVDRDDTAPPGSPVDGEAYLVATGGTGAWSGHDGEIALYISTAWAFKQPVEGMVLYVKDEDLRVVYDGADWVASGTTGGGTMVPVTTQTGTSYTFDLDDANSVVQFENAAAITATIPPNSSAAFEVGTFIEIHQVDAGTVTVDPDTGVTLLSRDSLVELAGQEAVAGIRKVATDTWRLTGDIA